MWQISNFENVLIKILHMFIIFVQIMYAALNFRDLMLASGKLSPEAITTDRLIQDRLQGFEYVGYDNK